MSIINFWSFSLGVRLFIHQVACSCCVACTSTSPGRFKRTETQCIFSRVEMNALGGSIEGPVWGEGGEWGGVAARKMKLAVHGVSDILN